MKELDDYFDLQKRIFDYFGYVEDWRVMPLHDCRDCYWCLRGGDPETGGGGCSVVYSPAHLAEMTDDNHYESEVYTQRHLPKWVYRGAEYTMIVTDPQTDMNIFLSVFSNDKEEKDPEDQLDDDVLDDDV
jgi:hypothetical protein